MRLWIVWLILLALPASVAAEPVRVFTWNHWPELDGIANPLIWAEYRVRPGHPFTKLPEVHPHHTPNWKTPHPVAEGKRVAALLKAQPEGRRALFLWSHAYGAYEPAKTQAGLKKMLTEGVSHPTYSWWIDKLFATIAAEGVKPDLIVVDNEDGFDWTPGVDAENAEARIAFLEEAMALPGVRQKYNGALADFNARDWVEGRQWWGKAPENTYRLWHFASGLKYELIEQTVIGPAKHHFGEVPVSQYGHFKPGWQVRELNNHPITSQRLMGEELLNSPVAYLWPGNYATVPAKQIPDLGRASYTIALEAERVVNVLEASAAQGETVPWFSDPMWNERGFAPDVVVVGWVRTFRAAGDAGINTFLVFNTSDDFLRGDPALARETRAASAAILRAEIERLNQVRSEK